ncbi:hypothetical protein D9M68_826620 [compost metagenome]
MQAVVHVRRCFAVHRHGNHKQAVGRSKAGRRHEEFVSKVGSPDAYIKMLLFICLSFTDSGLVPNSSNAFYAYITVGSAQSLSQTRYQRLNSLLGLAYLQLAQV